MPQRFDGIEARSPACGIPAEQDADEDRHEQPHENGRHVQFGGEFRLEEALGELVALGLAASDSFGGLRALLVPSGQRKPLAGAKRRGRVLSFDIASGGRWAMINRAAQANGDASRDAAVEYAARTLLARYGVVFWRLLTQEPGWLPPWRDLLRVFRRLEARGEIRGGRFVAGFSGEQFALPDAVGLLRETRRRPASGEWVSLSGADPLNLIGILTSGERIRATASNRIAYRDGVALSAMEGDYLRPLGDTNLDVAAALAGRRVPVTSGFVGAM